MPKILFMMSVVAGITLSCGNDSVDPDNNGGEEAETEQFYPDDYRPWADFSEREHWGPYNVHDPSCIDDGEWTYCFSTDAVYGGSDRAGIQLRRSKDLVNWEFVGWAFEGIPDEAFEYVAGHNEDNPTNIWAPYIMKVENGYRLYYSVSIFGSGASYIGLATSASPEGPWEQRGAVLTSTHEDNINTIDPSVIVDRSTGEHWMAYGSWSSGLYMTQLDPGTGKPLEAGDMGHPVARRNGDAIEAPEVIYHKPADKYYLFVSYGELFDVYNVRVGRSDHPEGPFVDYFGNVMSEETDNYPLLSAPYQFDNHSGWQGVGHVGVFRRDGQYFMMHQGRLGLDPGLMVMHLRKLIWTSDGWPVASPQRYGGIEQQAITADSITGEWEQILLEPVENGSVKNQSVTVEYLDEGQIAGKSATWELQDKILRINRNGDILNLHLRHGFDWENNRPTLIYTGLDDKGRSVWGKRINGEAINNRKETGQELSRILLMKGNKGFSILSRNS